MCLRQNAWIASASSGVATLPVPIAQTGSYAMVTRFMSAAETPDKSASSWNAQTASAFPASRSARIFNVIINISPSCDCSGNPEKPFVPNIGILVSRDIVAIEAAAHDLVDKADGSKDAFLKANSVSGKYQIDYAAQLGMGNKKYKLIDIDK